METIIIRFLNVFIFQFPLSFLFSYIMKIFLLHYLHRVRKRQQSSYINSHKVIQFSVQTCFHYHCVITLSIETFPITYNKIDQNAQTDRNYSLNTNGYFAWLSALSLVKKKSIYNIFWPLSTPTNIYMRPSHYVSLEYYFVFNFCFTRANIEVICVIHRGNTDLFIRYTKSKAYYIQIINNIIRLLDVL